MSGNRQIYVYEMSSPRYVLVRGFIREWLKSRDLPAMYSARLKGWCVRKDRLGDVLARAEFDGFDVRLKGQVAA